MAGVLGFRPVVPVVVARVAHVQRAVQPAAEEAGNPPIGDGDIKAIVTAVIAALTLATTSAAEPPAQFKGHRAGDQSWQWKWEKWLPDKWQRIGACETGYGKRPGRWDWNSGTYQGAFGFAVSSWDQFKPVSWWPDEAYLATPWQQYQTALAIHRRYGFSGWGCRNA